MDLILPVPPAALGVPSARYWRDIGRSDPYEVSVDGDEPLTVGDVKSFLSIDVDDNNGLIAALIPAARRLVDDDMNCSSTLRTLECVFDQFPIERAIPLPSPPLVSVDYVKYTDSVTLTEMTFDDSNYFLDTYSRPGLLILQPGKTWPTGVRAERGGKIRWKVGADSQQGGQERAVHAMRMLLAHWYENREAVAFEQLVQMVPLGYDALIGDRVRYFG